MSGIRILHRWLSKNGRLCPSQTGYKLSLPIRAHGLSFEMNGEYLGGVVRPIIYLGLIVACDNCLRAEVAVSESSTVSVSLSGVLSLSGNGVRSGMFPPGNFTQECLIDLGVNCYRFGGDPGSEDVLSALSCSIVLTFDPPPRVRRVNSRNDGRFRQATRQSARSGIDGHSEHFQASLDLLKSNTGTLWAEATMGGAMSIGILNYSFLPSAFLDTQGSLRLERYVVATVLQANAEGWDTPPNYSLGSVNSDFYCSLPLVFEEPTRVSFEVVSEQGVPGRSQLFPIFPDPQGNFGNVPSNSWVDPPLAYGFVYTMTDDNGFTEIAEFPKGIDSDENYTVYADGERIGDFDSSEVVDFVAITGGAVREFAVTGIQDAVDPKAPDAFPLKVAFDSDRASLRMEALTHPEPVLFFSEPGDVATIQWVSNRFGRYRLESSSDMVRWSSSESIEGDGKVVLRNYPVSDGLRFFRISVE